MDTFSLYDDLPLFSGDLLVGWNPLADELPVEVQDELQQKDKQMCSLFHHEDEKLFKGNLLEEPKEVEKTSFQSDYLNTNLNLVELLQSQDIPQNPVPLDIMQLDTKDMQQQPNAEEILSNVSEMLIANLTSAETPNESDSSVGQEFLDLSSLHNLSGETGMLSDEDVESILSGNDDQVDTFLNNSSDVLAADILSPVSPEDVDFILSSSPTSPYSTNASSPCSSTSVYSSHPASPYAVDNSFEKEPLVTETSDTSSTISMRYLREELLKPPPTANKSEKKLLPKNSSGRQKSQRQRVKYEPYSPPPFERYQKSSSHTKVDSKHNDCRSERKKQQNKDAALRYRQKKREEKMSVKDECNQLEEKNNELRDKVDSMTREIQYLKDLLAEVYKAKASLAKKSS